MLLSYLKLFSFCIGIGNSTDCTYVRAFSSHAVDSGFRVVVFNHLGALKTERITGNRIFSYGESTPVISVTSALQVA